MLILILEIERSWAKSKNIILKKSKIFFKRVLSYKVGRHFLFYSTWVGIIDGMYVCIAVYEQQTLNYMNFSLYFTIYWQIAQLRFFLLILSPKVRGSFLFKFLKVLMRRSERKAFFWHLCTSQVMIYVAAGIAKISTRVGRQDILGLIIRSELIGLSRGWRLKFKTT